MEQISQTWFSLLNALAANLSGPLTSLSDQVGIPAVSALILGLIGAFSPCQLSTNAAALAYVNRQAGSSHGLHRSYRLATAYLLGKATTYMALGAVAWMLGRGLNALLLPVVQSVRIVLGPTLILMGLVLLGWVPWRRVAGARLRSRFEERIGERGGPLTTYLLGAACALAFCPTLFLLFFGLLMPMAVANPPGGFFFPLVFAAGTAAPLFLLTALIGSGRGYWQARMRRLRTGGRVVNVVAGVVFVLAGLNDTVLYLLPTVLRA